MVRSSYKFILIDLQNISRPELIHTSTCLTQTELFMYWLLECLSVRHIYLFVHALWFIRTFDQHLPV